MLMLGSKSNSKLVSNQLVSNVPPNWPIGVCNGWNNRVSEKISISAKSLCTSETLSVCNQSQTAPHV